MFYFAVVLEKGQIVDGGLDPENEAELVVELDRNRPHGVFDPRPFNADVETVAYLAFVLRVEQCAPDFHRSPADRPVYGRRCRWRIRTGPRSSDIRWRSPYKLGSTAGLDRSAARECVWFPSRWRAAVPAASRLYV